MKEYELFSEIQNVLLDLVCNKTDTMTVDDATNQLVKVFKAAQQSVHADAGDSAASSELVQASALFTSQTLSSPQRG